MASSVAPATATKAEADSSGRPDDSAWLKYCACSAGWSRERGIGPSPLVLSPPPSLPPRSAGPAAAAFLSGGRQLLFHHSQENCVQLGRTEWAEQPAERSAAGGPPSLSPLATVPLATPVLFHCDRLTSSAQASLIHFFTVK